MEKRDELGEILKALNNFVEKREGHALGVIICPPAEEEEAEEEAKGVPVAGDWVYWIKTGNTTITLELIRHKFAQALKRLKGRDEAIVRDIKKREAKK